MCSVGNTTLHFYCNKISNEKIQHYEQQGDYTCSARAATLTDTLSPRQAKCSPIPLAVPVPSATPLSHTETLPGSTSLLKLCQHNHSHSSVCHPQPHLPSPSSHRKTTGKHSPAKPHCSSPANKPTLIQHSLVHSHRDQIPDM